MRRVIALNNAGVEMLGRCCFEQAQQTLMDAVDAIRTITDFDGEPVDEKAMCDAVQKASCRLSHPKPTCFASLSIEVRSDDGAVSAIGQVMQVNLLETTMHPIRIDKVDHQSPLELDICLVSAVIVYNCALSYLCPAKIEADPLCRQYLCSTAVNLLILASRICPCVYTGFPLRTIFLAMLILNTTIQAMAIVGNQTQTSAYLERLFYLEKMAIELQLKPYIVLVDDCVAAAA